MNRIFDTAATLKRQRLLQGKRKGTKSTSIISRTIHSTSEALSEYLAIYNANPNCLIKLNEKDVFDSMKENNFGSHFLKEIQFWKCIEQLVMTRRDIDDALIHIGNLNEKIIRLI